MAGLRPPLRRQPPSHRRALLWRLQRRAAPPPLRLRATSSRRPRRATPAASAVVPVAEEAVGAGPPLQAEAERDDPRHRLRTPLPAEAGRTNRIGNDRRNNSHLGAVSLCAALNCYSC